MRLVCGEGTYARCYLSTHPCRHPEASSRPTFSDLVTSFDQPDSKLLTCPSDVDPPEAVVLGAPLEKGENLYRDLQNKYQDLCNHYVL